MPTPDPNAGTQFIEIADFSPGIHSDQHAAVSPQYTGSPAETVSCSVPVWPVSTGRTGVGADDGCPGAVAEGAGDGDA